LVDLVLLTGLGLVLALTVGDSRVAGGGFSVSLTGVWLTLYVALVLLYYFALESAVGQTVGKRLLGLRVDSAGGGRPSAPAVAGRTLLRVLDWLPAMYLVGFVTMLATGARRQRVGDLAAGTVVARAQPGRRRSPALASLALVLLAVAGLFVYRAVGAEDAKTYRGHGVSFDYPAGWQEIDVRSLASEGNAEKLWNAAVGVGAVDLVTVDAYRLNVSVTTENLDAAEAAFEPLVRRLYQQLGGAVQTGPEEVTVGGKPGFRFGGTANLQGVAAQKTDIFVFDGTTEYQLVCQHTRENSAEIEQGCDQVLRTFTIA
jgi:uncharacterized RDD family membrane protein YckC